MDPSSILLTDKVVVVTGAARGIGRATAELCTRFGATRRHLRSGSPGRRRGASRRLFDVRDADARDVFVEGVVNKFGRIDVLVNNAGGTFFSPFLDVSDKGDATMIAENFGHVTALIRSVVPHMPAGGSIVNLTSIEAHQAAPGFAMYGAMKAALAHLTRTLALELAPLGIRVNAIAPDAIPTGGDARRARPRCSRPARPTTRRSCRRSASWATPKTRPRSRCSSRARWRASSPARPCTSTAATGPPAAGAASRITDGLMRGPGRTTWPGSAPVSSPSRTIGSPFTIVACTPLPHALNRPTPPGRSCTNSFFHGPIVVGVEHHQVGRAGRARSCPGR